MMCIETKIWFPFSNIQAYEFQELASDVLQIFDQFSKKKNVVIGHSYGATFCTLLGIDR